MEKEDPVKSKKNQTWGIVSTLKRVVTLKSYSFISPNSLNIVSSGAN
jgi:hypothetical protein